MRVAAPAAAQRAVASLAAQQRQPRSFQRLQQPLERRPFVTQCCAVPKPPRRRTRTRWGPSEQGAATSRTRVGDDAFNDESQEPDTLLDWGGDGAAWETSSSAPVLQNGFLSWDDATPPPADDPRDDARDAMYEADADDKPPALADVTPLSRAEQMTLLPFAATGAQYAFYWGAFDTALQRVFASLLGCLLTVDTSPLLAVPFGLYFLWVPVALAGRRNAPLRRYAYAGLWHARVLRVESYASRTPGGLVFDARGDAFLPKRRASEVRPWCPLCLRAGRARVTTRARTCRSHGCAGHAGAGGR